VLGIFAVLLLAPAVRAVAGTGWDRPKVEAAHAIASGIAIEDDPVTEARLARGTLRQIVCIFHNSVNDEAPGFIPQFVDFESADWSIFVPNGLMRPQQSWGAAFYGPQNGGEVCGAFNLLLSEIIRLLVPMGMHVKGGSWHTPTIFQDRDYAPVNYLTAGFSGNEFIFLAENKCPILEDVCVHRLPERLVGFIERNILQIENDNSGNSYKQSSDPQDGHNRRPISQMSRISIYLLFIGSCFLAYKAVKGALYGDYNLVYSAILVVIAVWLVGQGLFFLFLAAADRRAENVRVLSIIIAELELSSLSSLG
jgi:hypothetical protein